MNTEEERFKNWDVLEEVANLVSGMPEMLDIGHYCTMITLPGAYGAVSLTVTENDGILLQALDDVSDYIMKELAKSVPPGDEDNGIQFIITMLIAPVNIIISADAQIASQIIASILGTLMYAKATKHPITLEPYMPNIFDSVYKEAASDFEAKDPSECLCAKYKS